MQETAAHVPAPQISHELEGEGKGAAGVLGVLREIETQLAAHVAAVKKLQARISKAQKDVAKGKPLTRLTVLIRDLKSLAPLTPPDLRYIISGLERQLHQLTEAYGSGLAGDLRRAGEAQKVPVRHLPDGFAVGPFTLTVDPSKESGSLLYAKGPVVKELPLDPELIVKTVRELSDRLLATASFTTLAGQIEEAMRVAVARQKKAAGASPRHEMRVDLPAVYREMCFIRQSPAKGARKAETDYPPARFAVELKTLVQSEQNTAGDRRFRLETAVLENTKDPRKSVFIPADLSAGYGEGTYYQAIVLTSPEANP